MTEANDGSLDYTFKSAVLSPFVYSRLDNLPYVQSNQIEGTNVARIDLEGGSFICLKTSCAQDKSNALYELRQYDGQGEERMLMVQGGNLINHRGYGDELSVLAAHEAIITFVNSFSS